MNWQDTVERTVTGLGYELVDGERSAGGLLRVFIDRVPGQRYDTGEAESVTVEDCERVTRQLLLVLEVDGVDYARLEVSSPGLDRPLKREADYERFAGQQVEITLRQIHAGRKRYQGLLRRPPARPGLTPRAGYELVFKDGKDARDEKVLGFTLDEVREARLVPVIDFKGRRGRPAVPAAAAAPQDDDATPPLPPGAQPE
jgi:ribosome maturation factor RimP